MTSNSYGGMNTGVDLKKNTVWRRLFDWKSYHKAKVTKRDIEVQMLNLCLEEVVSTMFTSVLSEVIKNNYGEMSIGVDMKKNVVQ